MNIKKCIAVMSLVLLCLSGAKTMAETAVVVHPSNNSEFSKETVKRLFLGKDKAFSSGEVSVPVNVGISEDIRVSFDKKVLTKTSNQIKAYWSKLVFTGKDAPPIEVDINEVKDLIAANPNMIGYIPSSEVDSTVRVAYTY